MECNKDEAAKAKQLAEKKFLEKDITESWKFALKAQRLFPSLDGIPDLLATLNIYVSAEKNINGEVDWYKVLGVLPSSNEDTMRKQYRKLALTLHPDKNKSVGAEGAFQIVSEAWSLLSDKARREAYDKKRSSRGIYTKVTPSNPSKPNAGDNGNFCNKTRNYPNPHSVQFASLRRKTFWTVCMGCKMQFEYVLLYLNKKLECHNCKKPFEAIQIPSPQLNSQAPYSAHTPQHSSNNLSEGRKSRGPAGHSDVQSMNRTQATRESTNKVHGAAQSNANTENEIKGRTNALKTANSGETTVEKPKRKRRTKAQMMNDSRGEKSSSKLRRGRSETADLGNSNGFRTSIGVTEKISIGSKPRKTKERVRIKNEAKTDAESVNHLGNKPNDRNLDPETQPSCSSHRLQVFQIPTSKISTKTESHLRCE